MLIMNLGVLEIFSSITLLVLNLVPNVMDLKKVIAQNVTIIGLFKTDSVNHQLISFSLNKLSGEENSSVLINGVSLVINLKEPLQNVVERVMSEDMISLEKVPKLEKHINYLNIKDLELWLHYLRLILGITNSFSLPLMELESGKNKSVSQVEVFNYVEKLPLTGLKFSWKLMKFSITIQRRPQLLFLPLLIKMLLMNHGVSENTNSSMKLNKNVQFSILNVTIRVSPMISVEDQETLKKTVYHPLLDLLRSPLKEKLLFMRIMTSKERRLSTVKASPVLKNMISNSFK